MSCDFGIIYHPWSYAGQTEPLLERAVGEVGIEHLTIPAVTGPVTQFRLNPAAPPNLFSTAGGWHFPPAADTYKSGPIRPRAARWFGKRNILERLADYAQRRNLRLIARLALRGVPALIEHEAHIRTRNAWGDEDSAAGACVLNPGFRELLLATIRDLTHCRVSGFQLVDWKPDLAVDRALPRPMCHTPAIRALLDICFCPACRQIALTAGLDPDLAARSVRTHAERALADGVDLERQLADDEVLREYLAVRRRDSAAWLGRLAQTHPDHTWHSLIQEPSATATLLDPNSAAIEPHAGLLVPITGDAKGSPLADDVRSVTDHSDCGRIMSVWKPTVTRPDELVRRVAEAAGQYGGPIDFDGLEQAPVEVIDWLRQAVRFARRR